MRLILLLIATLMTATTIATGQNLTGEHVCEQEERYFVNVTRNVQKNATVRVYVWCMNIPPRCSTFKFKTYTEQQIQEEERTRKVPVCCIGYEPNPSGKNCLPKCNCVNGVCDEERKCYCHPGFRGDHCERGCEFSRWGRYCRYHCTCERGECDPVNGHCKCPNGWRGTRCEHQCGDGHFGHNCKERCDCQDGEMCSPSDGRCLSKDKLPISDATTNNTKENVFKIKLSRVFIGRPPPPPPSDVKNDENTDTKNIIGVYLLTTTPVSENVDDPVMIKPTTENAVEYHEEMVIEDNTNIEDVEESTNIDVPLPKSDVTIKHFNVTKMEIPGIVMQGNNFSKELSSPSEQNVNDRHGKSYSGTLTNPDKVIPFSKEVIITYSTNPSVDFREIDHKKVVSTSSKNQSVGFRDYEEVAITPLKNISINLNQEDHAIVTRPLKNTTVDFRQLDNDNVATSLRNINNNIPQIKDNTSSTRANFDQSKFENTTHPKNVSAVSSQTEVVTKISITDFHINDYDKGTAFKNASDNGVVNENDKDVFFKKVLQGVQTSHEDSSKEEEDDTLVDMMKRNVPLLEGKQFSTSSSGSQTSLSIALEDLLKINKGGSSTFEERTNKKPAALEEFLNKKASVEEEAVSSGSKEVLHKSPSNVQGVLKKKSSSSSSVLEEEVHFTFTRNALVGIVSTALAIFVFVLGAGFYASARIKENVLNEDRRRRSNVKMEEEENGGCKEYAFSAKSIFHFPLPDPPDNYSESTIKSLDKNTTFKSFSTATEGTYKSSIDYLELFYDQPPSKGSSYRSTTAPQPPSPCTKQIEDDASKAILEPIYDEISSHNEENGGHPLYANANPEEIITQF